MSQSLGSVVVAIKAVDEASGVMDKIRGGLGILGNSLGQLGGGFEAAGSIISGFAGAGVLGAVAAATTQVIGGLQESISVFQSFEAAMAKVQTTTGASAEELAQLKDLAVDLSTKFGVSANQVAEALYYMSGGMVDAAAASQAIGPALALAIAAGLDAKEAAVAISDLGTQFKLFSDDSDATAAALQHVTDTLVFASQNFQVEVNQLISSFKAVGPIASQLGLNLDEVVTALGLLADAGFRADESGTGLRALLMNLASPGKEAAKALEELNIQVFDAEGKMLSLTDIIAQFGTAMDGMTQAEQLAFAEMLVGTQHASKLLVLVGAGADTMGDFTDQMQSTASASETVATKLETLEAKQARANAAWEAASIALGEKLLPVAAGAQEAIANLGLAFAEGIDAISAWLDEVGKMPEVKAVTDAVSGAFEGLMKWFDDLGKSAAEILGPALQELWLAFKDIWDALAPIGEALGEIWSIFSEGEGSGNILKDILGLVALNIKALAVVIKEVAPFIKQFAEGFKAAAEFIAPVLVQLKDAIGGFIDWLRNTFQGFYDWLVGRSLWQQMWDAVLAVTGTMIATLLSDVTGKLIEPIKTAFTDFMGRVKTTWDQGWQAVQTAFTQASTTLQSGVTTAFNQMRDFIRTNLGEYAPIANLALTNMENVTKAGLAIMRGDWDSALGYIQNAISGGVQLWQQIMSGAMNALQGAMQSGLSLMKGAWDGFVGGLQGGIRTVQTAFGQVQAATQTAAGAVTGALQGAFDTISSAATGFWNWLVGGSLWPEMLDEMQSITETALTTIKDQFETIFTGIAGAADTSFKSVLSSAQSGLAGVMGTAQAAITQMSALAAQAQTRVTAALKGYDINVVAQVLKKEGYWAPALGTFNLTGAELQAYADMLAQRIYTARGSPSMQEYLEEIDKKLGGGWGGTVNLPISVNIDGATVSRVVEQRMISQRQLAGG